MSRLVIKIAVELTWRTIISFVVLVIFAKFISWQWIPETTDTLALMIVWAIMDILTGTARSIRRGA